MKVQRLVELLLECDPDAEVKILGKRTLLSEFSIEGIVVRRDMYDHDADNKRLALPSWKRKSNDVFIVEDVFLSLGIQNGMWETRT